MADFVVTPTQLDALAASVARTAAEVRAQHDALRSQLAVGPDWLGAAADQFRTLYGRYDTYASRLLDVLDGIGHLLRHAGMAYARADAEVAALFRPD